MRHPGREGDHVQVRGVGLRECFPKLCNRNRAGPGRPTLGRVNFVSTPELLEFLPRAVLMPQAVDIDLVEAVANEPPPAKDPNRFVVAHAPTNRQIKGTHYLLDAVARLKARGYPIDLLLVENLPHADALHYRRADVAVDQLLVGSYGLLAAELMALGVPTAVYLPGPGRPLRGGAAGPARLPGHGRAGPGRLLRPPRHAGPTRRARPGLCPAGPRPGAARPPVPRVLRGMTPPSRPTASGC